MEWQLRKHDSGTSKTEEVQEPPYRPKNPDALPGKLLAEPLKKIERFPNLEDAPPNDLKELIDLLDNRIIIDGRGENAEGASLYTDFCLKWEEYLARHPDVKARVDPHYVVAVPPILQGFTAAVYAPGQQFANAALTPVHGVQDFMWAFPHTNFGRAHANHFIGYMQARFPGLIMWLLSTGAAFVQY